MKKYLRDKIIFPLLERLPLYWRNKLKMAGTCCFGKGWGYFQLAFFAEEFKDISSEDVKKLYGDLSEHSLNVLMDYLKYNHLSAAFCQHLDRTGNDSIIVPLEQLFPGLIEKITLENKICRKIVKKTCFDAISSETGFYHHGLKFIDSAVKEYIKDKVFIDSGAFIGDSAFAFAQYAPKKILAFEPSEENCCILRKNLEKEKIGCVEIIQKGVSDVPGELLLAENASRTALNESGKQRIEVVTIDGFLQNNLYGRIGVIKADLEGMGLKMVQGAIETIKRDRPVLLLAIYHNQDEFMGIYKLLKEELPDYQYRIDALSGLCEVTLLAWPGEAKQTSGKLN